MRRHGHRTQSERTPRVRIHQPRPVALQDAETADLCAAGELEHYRFESVGGRVTFKVAESAIRAYLNRARQSAS